MSMTREKAIIALESIRRFKEMCGGKDVDGIETLDLALSALRGPTREQVERMRGEWKAVPRIGVYDTICSKCGYAPGIRFFSSDFCPACGSPMTDEAVDMMLERWKEALHGEAD